MRFFCILFLYFSACSQAAPPSSGADRPPQKLANSLFQPFADGMQANLEAYDKSNPLFFTNLEKGRLKLTLYDGIANSIYALQDKQELNPIRHAEKVEDASQKTLDRKAKRQEYLSSLRSSKVNTHQFQRYIKDEEKAQKKLAQAATGCEICNGFLDRNASAVTVQEDGSIKSVYFHDPEKFDIFYRPAVTKMKKIIEEQKPDTPLYKKEQKKEKASKWVHIDSQTVNPSLSKGESDEIKNVFSSFEGTVKNISEDTIVLLQNAAEGHSDLFKQGVDDAGSLSRNLSMLSEVKKTVCGVSDPGLERAVIKRWMAKHPKELSVFHIKKTLIGFLLKMIEEASEEEKKGWFITIANGNRYPTDKVHNFLSEKVNWYNQNRAEKSYKVKKGLPSTAQLDASKNGLKPIERSLQRRFKRQKSIDNSLADDAFHWRSSAPKDDSFLTNVKTKNTQLSPLKLDFCTAKEFLVKAKKAKSIHVELNPKETYPFASLTTACYPESEFLLTYFVPDNITADERGKPCNWHVNGDSVPIISIIKHPKDWFNQSCDRHLLVLKDCHPQKAVPFDVDSSNVVGKYRQHGEVLGQLKQDSKYNIKGDDSTSGLVMNSLKLVRYIFLLIHSDGRKERIQIH